MPPQDGALIKDFLVLRERKGLQCSSFVKASAR